MEPGLGVPGSQESLGRIVQSRESTLTPASADPTAKVGPLNPLVGQAVTATNSLSVAERSRPLSVSMGIPLK